MKKLMLTLFIPILISCNTYHGVKYELKYDENASLKEITPKEMYDIGAINKLDSVFLIAGLDECSSCIKAKEDVSKYINKYHASIYFININNVTYADDYSDLSKEYENTDYYYLYEATVKANDGIEDAYSLPHPNNIKDLALPVMYFFKYGGVGTKVNQDFYNSLTKYVKVMNN